MQFTEAINKRWHMLGENYYEKISFYDLPWDGQFDLSRFKIACGQFGGNIALFLDSQTTASGSISKPFIQIFTAAGQTVSQQLWKDSAVVGMNWTNTENLALVQTTGKVAVFNLRGDYQRTFSMGNEAEENGILDCRFFPTEQGTGLAVLTGRHRLFCVNCIDDPRIRRFPEVPGLTRPPASWVIYSGQALVARDRDIYLLDQSGSVRPITNPPIEAPYNAVISMAVAPSQKLVALFLDTGVLWVGDAEISRTHCEYDTGRAGSRPLQMVWCASAGVLLYWPGYVLLVGPQKDIWEYSYPSFVHMSTEMDGVHLITADRHEFLQRVPRDLEEIGRTGDSPGMWLSLAEQELARGSGCAEDYLCVVAGERLLPAVKQCLAAAGQAYQPDLQKRMLMAARLGRGFLEDGLQHELASAFADQCRTLRVLNNLHHPMIGIPMTLKQLRRLTIPVLLDRLIARGHYPMAQKIGEHLRLPEAEAGNRVLGHWACGVVEKAQDEMAAARKIVGRLGDKPGVSYANIASRAKDFGKEKLAEQLLEHECRTSEQVPLLLKLGLYPRALAKAVDSGDPELIELVLGALRGLQPSGELVLTLRKHPTAMALYTARLEAEGERGETLAGQMLEQEDNRGGQARAALGQAFREDKFDKRSTELEKASRLYKQSHNDFMAQEVDDANRLLRYQRRLEEELKLPFVGLSLHRTLYQLVLKRNTKLVNQLKTEFKVPDKRFWRVKMAALADNGDWPEIEKMSREKRRPPVGMETFLDICLAHDNKEEATKYLPKLEPEARIKYLLKLDRVDEAIDTAYSLKSEESLNYLHQHLVRTNRPAADRVHAMLAHLK